MTISTVDVPEPFADIFRRAEEYAQQYFGALKHRPECGTLEISGERYILIRAAAMSVEFTDLRIGIYREGSESEGRQLAANLLFDLGHAFGKSDARHFHAYMGITDPVERLSIGPVQFAFSGWASVKIDDSSRVMANENYYLVGTSGLDTGAACAAMVTTRGGDQKMRRCAARRRRLPRRCTRREKRVWIKMRQSDGGRWSKKRVLPWERCGSRIGRRVCAAEPPAWRHVCQRLCRVRRSSR